MIDRYCGMARHELVKDCEEDQATRSGNGFSVPGTYFVIKPFDAALNTCCGS